MSVHLIVSLKHTHKHHEHITFWRPNHCGYTPVVTDAGVYGAADAQRLNDGESYIAVPVHAVHALSSPTPFWKPGAQFYDIAGPVVDNTRANWNKLIASSIEPGRHHKPKPEPFRGKRRSFPEPSTAASGNAPERAGQITPAGSALIDKKGTP